MGLAAKIAIVALFLSAGCAPQTQPAAAPAKPQVTLLQAAIFHGRLSEVLFILGCRPRYLGPMGHEWKRGPLIVEPAADLWTVENVDNASMAPGYTLFRLRLVAKDGANAVPVKIGNETIYAVAELIDGGRGIDDPLPGLSPEISVRRILQKVSAEQRW